jgi:hypothetical protein
MFENRELRRTFGPKESKWQEVGGYCILRSFFNLYSSPSIISMMKPMRMRWAGRLAGMGISDAYKISVGKPERKSLPRRPRRIHQPTSWSFWWSLSFWLSHKYFIITISLPCLQEPSNEPHKDWIDVAQDMEHWRALVNTVINLRVP